ncbi:MAG: hypothetical protein ACI9FU_001982 [Granulosicoccus sp.]|jgi:hypothetical protein
MFGLFKKKTDREKLAIRYSKIMSDIALSVKAPLSMTIPDK